MVPIVTHLLATDFLTCQIIWEDHSLLLVSLLETFGVTCWKDQAVFYKLKCPLVLLKEITIFFSRNFFSKHNVAPLYWSLPPRVLCQRLRQIMVLRSHSLISLLFSLVKEYGSRMNLEILILHFENKSYFDVSLKQFAFEILQLLGYFLSWKRDYLLLCLAMRSSVKIRHEMTFCFYRFSKWRAREKKNSRFCLRKTTCLLFNIHFYQHE